jgi:hypothetical protein
VTNTLKIRLGPNDIAVCDFCSSEKITKDYDCPDYTVPVTNDQGQTMELGSTGKWVACAICAELIDRGDRTELMGRALQTIYARHPDWPKDGPVAEGLAKFVHDLHEGFWQRMRARG